MTITKQERDSIMERQNKLMQFCRAQGFTNPKNGWTSYKPEQVAHLNPPANEERSQVEIFDFINDIPKRYFLYIDEKNSIATTWMGNELGGVSFGREWKDNFGGKRVSIKIKAINGKNYSGTYFKSSGNYAKIKLVK